MKIAFLSTFFPFRGGIAQFNALLYRALEKNNSVKAFTFKRQYPNFLFPGETQMVQENDQVDEIPSERVLDSISPASWWNAARKINQFEPDLILTKYWMTFFGPSLGYILKKMRPKTIRISILDNVIPHEKRFFDGFANRLFLSNNDGFIVMSDAVLSDLLSLKPHAKYIRLNHPVYNHFGESVDQKWAQEKLGLNPELKTLLFFGFIRDYKGLDLLIEAMNHLDETYQLIIAGEVYGSFDTYQKSIDTNKNKARIHCFQKYISDEEVPLFYSASDVCLLPYKSATQSGITSIAHHFNLPIIATDVGGLKETIHHRKTGLIVEKPEAEAIAAGIQQFFNVEDRASMTEEIIREKEANSWENFAKKTMEFATELRDLKHS